MADFNERIREMGQQTFANATQTTQNAAGMFNRAMQDFYSIGLSVRRLNRRGVVNERVIR